MKPLLPLLTVSLFTLGACGLEKPPAKIVFPEDKTAAAPAAAPAAPAEPVAPAAPVDPKFAAAKTLYDASCASCHDAALMGAPKPGDKANWAPRIAQGIATVESNAIKGFQGKVGMMPAKGGSTLTDDEIKSIVAYLVEVSK
ncbi:c-type cytochrome [Chlorobium ferrooxidans]|uniref:Cytochrome c, class I n=1 Tax=Chlorobium ferrooxidans DSM 13031 TaxID=377431 RepID=Q0YPM0_9CHLB|nr:c-type cytochrome [Chlorobium ferrooxidans]EAT58215.1 Cytochrome c, class I [Chlorobium ferrooxidans DSM 13031]